MSENVAVRGNNRRGRRGRKVGPKVKSTNAGVKELLTRSDVTHIVKRVTSKEAEKKYHEVEVYDGGVSSGATISDLSAIVRGTGFNQRTGIRATPTFLVFKYQVTISDVTNRIRVILFQWKPTSDPAVGQILKTPDQGIGLYGGLEMYDTFQRENRVILYDQSHLLDSSTPTEMVSVSLNLKKMKRRQQRDIIWGEGDATTTHSGGIYLYVVSDSGAVAHPTISYVSRLYYIDP